MNGRIIEAALFGAALLERGDESNEANAVRLVCAQLQDLRHLLQFAPHIDSYDMNQIVRIIKGAE